MNDLNKCMNMGIRAIDVFRRTGKSRYNISWNDKNIRKVLG